MRPQWQSSIRRCEKSGNHPNEDLAKYDYNPNIKKIPWLSGDCNSHKITSFWNFSVFFFQISPFDKIPAVRVSDLIWFESKNLELTTRSEHRGCKTQVPTSTKQVNNDVCCDWNQRKEKNIYIGKYHLLCLHSKKDQCWAVLWSFKEPPVPFP